MSEDFAAALGGFGPGSRVAGYLLEEQIGQGGMAVVFRAMDERLSRHVALKILAPAIAADEALPWPGPLLARHDSDGPSPS